jgi:hypothetical protein
MNANHSMSSTPVIHQGSWRRFSTAMPDEEQGRAVGNRCHDSTNPDTRQDRRFGFLGSSRRCLGFVVGVLLCPISSAFAIGYDETVGDQRVAYRYMDQVQEDVGFEAFGSTSAANALQLALTLGKLDRLHLTSEGFVRHLRQVEKVKERFYKTRKLTADEVTAYLLPYRIRCEHTSKPVNGVGP